MNWYKTSYILCFIISLMLISGGAYFTFASIGNYETKDQMLRIKAMENLSKTELEQLVQKQKENIFNSGLMYQDLALAELILANEYGYFTPDGNKTLQDAYAHIQKGVELSPARSIGWTRMAYIKLLLDGPSKEIADIINMAIIVAPDEYDSMYFRIQISFSVWEYCDDEQKELIKQQIRLGWNKHQEQIIDLIKNQFSKDIIDSAMQDSGDYESFKKAL